MPNDLKHWKRFIFKIIRLHNNMSSENLKLWQSSPRVTSQFDTRRKDEQASKKEFPRNRNSLPEKNYDKKIKEQLASWWKQKKEQKKELSRGAQKNNPCLKHLQKTSTQHTHRIVYYYYYYVTSGISSMWQIFISIQHPTTLLRQCLSHGHLVSLCI